MHRRLPDIADGVPIYDLLCLGDGGAPSLRLETPVAGRTVDDGHVSAVAAATVRAATHRTTRRLRTLYSLVRADSPAAYAPAVLDALAASEASPAQLRIVGRWLATRGVHHGPVALGILTLGAAGFGDDGDIVRCLGADPSFTEVAAFAAQRGASDPEQFVWDLARSVTGSARTTCVRLLAGTRRPDIARWVLGEGWGGLGDPAGALSAVEVGALDAALTADRVDDGVVDSAARIFRTLTAPGAEPDLAAFSQAPVAVDAYLRLVGQRPFRTADFLAVEAIRRFLIDRGGPVTRVWTAPGRAQAIGRCAAVLAEDAWDPVLSEGLEAASDIDFPALAVAAEARGIDTFPFRLARLEASPSAASWRMALDDADPMRARRLAAVAARSLRTAAESSPPEASVWGAFDALLEFLGRYPGVGGDVVVAGLAAGTPAHRLAALRTLEMWGRDHWPDEALRMVRAGASGDPDGRVRALATRLLS